jgi:hypothetical protein
MDCPSLLPTELNKAFRVEPEPNATTSNQERWELQSDDSHTIEEMIDYPPKGEAIVRLKQAMNEWISAVIRGDVEVFAHEYVEREFQGSSPHGRHIRGLTIEVREGQASQRGREGE